VAAHATVGATIPWCLNIVLSVVALQDLRLRRLIEADSAWLRLVSSDTGRQVDYKFSSWLKSVDFETAAKLSHSRGDDFHSQ
jgi:hypothetical protein